MDLPVTKLMDKSTSEYHTNQLQMEQWISNSDVEPNSAPPNQHKALNQCDYTLQKCPNPPPKAHWV